MPYSDLTTFAPELTLCALGLLVLLVDMFLPRRATGVVPALTLVGLALTIPAVLALWGRPPTAEFMGAWAVDRLALAFKLFFIAVGMFITVMSWGYFRASESRGEIMAFIVFMVLGMCLMAGANDLVLIYLAFELVSLLSYLLAAWRREDRKSNEAGIKYFIYGAAASAVMLYGLTLIYGAGGSTNLRTLADHFMQPQGPGAGLALPAVLGVLLMTVGFGYKISMVPFHAWAPDVYEGAPTPITALLSVGPKAAGFALLIRVFAIMGPSLQLPWQVVFAVLATVTMFGGNLLAIRQTNIKRMLAYSSIAHAGYLLIPFVVGVEEPWALPGLYVYLVAYLLMNLGIFAAAIVVERATGSSDIDRFTGLARVAPGLAAAVVILLLSLTGIPPTAGFLGKLLIFAAAMKSGTWAWLAVVGIVNSAISLYYYMGIVRAMYFVGDHASEGYGTEPAHEPLVLRPAFADKVIIVATTVATVALLFLPQQLISWAQMIEILR